MYWCIFYFKSSNDRGYNITSVDIGNSVISIGENAFFGLSQLKTITIPESMIIIDGYAFDDSTALETVIIKSRSITIGPYAFDTCTSLKTVTYYGTTPPICQSTTAHSCNGCQFCNQATGDCTSLSTTVNVPKGYSSESFCNLQVTKVEL